MVESDNPSSVPVIVIGNLFLSPPNVPANDILPVTTPVPLSNEDDKAGLDITVPSLSFITILLVSISESKFCADNVNLIDAGLAVELAALSNANTFESVVNVKDFAYWVVLFTSGKPLAKKEGSSNTGPLA